MSGEHRSPSDDASVDEWKPKKEQARIGSYPHHRGITRGTVLEYDGWQWALVTEIDEDYQPPKVGFILLDKLTDGFIKELESARGCWEHYKAVSVHRGSNHEYWTDVEYLDEDIWTVLGPIHPDEREGEPGVSVDV